MKNLDTHTVLEIIKMIDAQKAHYTRIHNDTSIVVSKEADGFFHGGVIGGLSKLQDHLQSYIEGQLNAEELRTRE